MDNTCQITFTANAGLIIQIGESTVFVDALHSGSPGKYSSVSEETLYRITEDPVLGEPDVLLFSHCHEDHFSEEMTRKFIRERTVPCILPERRFSNQITLREDYEEYVIAGIRIVCLRIPHMKSEENMLPLYGFVLEKDGKRILLPGDCEVGSPELGDYLQMTGKINLAVLNYPWAALLNGRRFIKEYINPQEILIIHAPYEAEDSSNIHTMLSRQIERAGIHNIRVMKEPLQTEAYLF